MLGGFPTDFPLSIYLFLNMSFVSNGELRRQILILHSSDVRREESKQRNEKAEYQDRAVPVQQTIQCQFQTQKGCAPYRDVKDK